MINVFSSIYLRSFIFGFEDSLVSTVGLLSGIAFAGITAREIILTGTVLVFVEAFSMGVSMYLSENSIEEYEAQALVSKKKSLISGVITFLSYCLAGFSVLLPYIIFSTKTASVFSILIAFILLFALGWSSGKISKISPLKKALTMVTVGGLATLIGVGVGYLFS